MILSHAHTDHSGNLPSLARHGFRERVFCTPATFNPDEKWVMQQARNAAMWMQDEGIQPMMLLMDRDTKFTVRFRYFWQKMKVTFHLRISARARGQSPRNEHPCRLDAISIANVSERMTEWRES